MTVLLDAAGRRRSPATMPGYHAGRSPRKKGMHYPADPPTVEEIVAVMRHTGDNRHGWRVRAKIVVLWRAGLRIQEALALAEQDLDERRGSLLVRAGKGGRRREVGMTAIGSARPQVPTGVAETAALACQRASRSRRARCPQWTRRSRPRRCPTRDCFLRRARVFMVVGLPLRLPGGTGSPWNAIAVF
jgi:hypothetical protein